MLKVFIASIVCCAAVGICCLLVGRVGSFVGRVLATTGTISGLAILGLGSATVWERRRWHPVGLLGTGAGVVTLVLTLAAIWVDWWRLRAGPGEEVVFKSTGIAWVTTVALTHVGLLGLARLKRGYEWARVLTVIAVVLLALQIDGAIITEVDSDWGARIMGILAICVACGTIAIPILHRMSRLHVREAVCTTELMLSLTCPRCQRVQQVAVGRSKCAGCGLKFNLEIEEEHCPQCGYSLYKLESANCPECGAPVTS